MSKAPDKPVRSKDNFLVFGAPTITEAEIGEVIATLESGWIGTGPRTSLFESHVADYKGGRHAVAVSSCTAALHLSLVAAGIGEGDEVITTPITFCATVNAIIHSGATPVLADIDPKTMNIDPGHILAMITERTRAIIPVHLAGLPCAMDEILAVASANDLLIIEDCAHAIETEYSGKAAGRLGDYGCLSFYATKNITTGEGGLILTQDSQAERVLRTLAQHGLDNDSRSRFESDVFRHYDVVAAGFKYNMTDIQAAIGIHQLARVEKNWQTRKSIWSFYQSELKDSGLQLPTEARNEDRHGYHLYTILVDEQRCGISRDALIDRLVVEGIGTGVHYRSVGEYSFYQQKFGWRPEECPEAMRVGRQTLSLPMTAGMSQCDAEDVVTAVLRHVGR